MFNHPYALELAYIAVEEAIRLGATYADARFEQCHHEELATENGALTQASLFIERGLGVRALVHGAWGHASVSEPNRHDVAQAAKRAVDQARAAAVLQERAVEVVDQVPHRGMHRTSIKRDPLAVPLEEKIELLFSIDRRLRRPQRIVLAEAHFIAQRQRKIFVSSEGSELDQELVHTGVGYRAGASDGKELQIRSYPFGDGVFYGRGWEVVAELALAEHAEETAEEALALLAAPPCPLSTKPVILGGAMMAAHLLGASPHLFELDRSLGWVASAGRPGLLGADRLGSYDFGSKAFTLYADAKEFGGAGTYAFDDEGVEAQRVELVGEGRLLGFLSGRDSARRVGLERAHGVSRASSWADPPQVRPSNLVLAPGTGSLEQLIADTKDGLLIDGPRSFGLEAEGQRFVATGEVCWEIKDGRRVRLLKNPCYAGELAGAFKGLKSVAEGARMYGGLVGKGWPQQKVPVGASAGPALFVGLEVGDATRARLDGGDAPPVAKKAAAPRKKTKKKTKRTR